MFFICLCVIQKTENECMDKNVYIKFCTLIFRDELMKRKRSQYSLFTPPVFCMMLCGNDELLYCEAFKNKCLIDKLVQKIVKEEIQQIVEESAENILMPINKYNNKYIRKLFSKKS